MPMYTYSVFLFVFVGVHTEKYTVTERRENIVCVARGKQVEERVSKHYSSGMTATQ